MQVQGHVVSLYVATCGQNGPALGSDEKEIILLVYVVIDAATNTVSAEVHIYMKIYRLIWDRFYPGRRKPQKNTLTKKFNSKINKLSYIYEIHNLYKTLQT